MADKAKKSGTTSPGLAKGSTRAVWKGAITFGLVHIPIALHSATAESDLNFDWLDKRTGDPVGYKRINKRTGKEIESENIVKGLEYQKGEYVTLTGEEIAEAYPRTTQTIDIEAFVDIDEVPFVYLEKPYYTSPIMKGGKVYALLREALVQTGKAGIARVVIHTKQHLAILVPCGPALVLNLMRWGDEVRTWDDLDLPPANAKSAGLRENELKMAKQLIGDMAGHWKADEYRDSFHDAIMKLVDAKARAGDSQEAVRLEDAPQAAGADVIDLTELLKRSLQGGRASGKDEGGPARKAVAKSTGPAKKAATRERAVASAGRKTAARRKPAAKAASKTKRAA
ncbi:Ku protein [Ramlibacter sp.]|uniref:non-homologous end joining protein Ku n=1 Tax=Ramlibacter sp. TaxID=1917967 RepID=UPI003D0BA1CF